MTSEFPVRCTTSRRRFLALLGGGVALLGSTALTQVSYGQAVPVAGPQPFSFDGLIEEARNLARQPYVADTTALPEFIRTLDYDSYRLIEFKAEHARWAQDDSRFQLHAYHLGGLYTQKVQLFDVADGHATAMAFRASDFEYRGAALKAQSAAQPLPGIAGFRVNYPINNPLGFDELFSFLGASYFRALGRGNIYGISARGIAVNTTKGSEEFPRFSRFYLERTGDEMAVYALLEGASVTGAFRFVIVPGTIKTQETAMNVTAQIFCRTDVEELGIAPLTSMFLYDANNRAEFDDYRPAVHDSDGLGITRKNGERLWRALNNPPAIAKSYIWEDSPKAFGLYQRARQFEDYQDAEAQYERRPSVEVEPVGDWGPGEIRLVELPTPTETQDNIVAFWTFENPLAAGDELKIGYRLRWGNLPAKTTSKLGYVQATRIGQGGVAGSLDIPDHVRKFVVDFTGGELDEVPAGTPLDALPRSAAARCCFLACLN